MHGHHLFVVFTILVAAIAKAEEPKTNVRPLRVGESVVEVLSNAASETPRWLLVNLHDDENTSVEAALTVMAESPCRLVELKHSGEREIAFSIGIDDYRCDPNRIFTNIGVRATLEKLSTLDEAAEREVARLGQSLIEQYRLQGCDAVIALHNNTDERYSANSYAEGQEYETDAAAVHLEPGQDQDDFYFVTEQRFFDAIKKRGLNVVLQDNEKVTDDGSLSVYCASQHIPYVNVEAQHGHLEKQVQMLRTLFGVLNELCVKKTDVGSTTK